MRVSGEETYETVTAANNYAISLLEQGHFEETKSLLRPTLPIVQRVLGDNNELVFRMKKVYVEAFLLDGAATPDEFREAVTMIEDTERTARRVLGGTHPFALDLARAVKVSRAALFIRETQPAEDPAEEVD